MAFLLLRVFLWPVVRLFIRKVDGLENIPEGKFIVASSHASYIDPLLLMMLFSRKKKLRFFATKDGKFKGFCWNFWFSYAGAIRVNGSIEKGLEAVRQGDCIGIFPEGGRTYSGLVQDVEHSGLGVLALKTGLPVVPVGMNTFWFWNRFDKWPSFRRNIRVCIGKPKRFNQKLTKKNAEKVVSEVMRDIKKLVSVANG